MLLLTDHWGQGGCIVKRRLWGRARSSVVASRLVVVVEVVVV